MRKIKGVLAVGMAAAMMLSATACGKKKDEATSNDTAAVTTEAATSTVAEVEIDEDNILVNPYFLEDDVTAWQAGQGSSKVGIADESVPLPDGYRRCAVIDRDPESSSPYDCFAQDITSSISKGTEYQFEFYAMLSSDYEGAPAEQRTVEFAPYITANGSTTYLGSYSAEITGVSSQPLEPGKWTRFAGTFTPQWSGNLDQAVIRVIEQGTDYGNGDCVKGDYYIAGFKLLGEKAEPVVYSVEKDIPSLASVVSSEDGLGADSICGTAVTGSEIDDEFIQELISKHFNAVTLGNELKMDAVFGYSNDTVPAIEDEEADINGEKIKVPVMDHSRADKILDKILEINEKNGANIKVRGHVLVWHSQAPEWFFHEDYDKTKPYVDKDTMNLRLEWYIRELLNYYTGPDSKYRDLFYGWDVVNEAISDGTGTYRTDEEPGADQLSDSTHGSKSSWWKVYGSNEFIINAFKYANRYAPATLKLYYNDYNECDATKEAGIIELINAVKEADGTRIDGFGMQGHYSVNAPTVDRIKEAIQDYSQVVDEVMITEFDVKAGLGYDGTDETKDKEYTKQAHYFRKIYEAAKELNAEGVHFSGITMWGVVDKYSWLQSQNNVGGSSDGTSLQCPLLFDDNYQAKPAYWAFVDPSKLGEEPVVVRPEINIKKGSATVDGDIEEAWDAAEAVSLSIKLGSDISADGKLLWDEENLYVLVDVKDSVLNEDSEDDYQQDSVESFVDENNGKSGGYEADDKQYRISFSNKQSFNGEKCVAENITSATKKTDDGYVVEAAIKWTDITPEVGGKAGVELQVNDATAEGVRCGTISWADDTGTGYMSPEVFGTVVFEE